MRVSKITLFTFRRLGTMIRPAITRAMLGFDSTNSLQNTRMVTSSAVTDTDPTLLVHKDFAASCLFQRIDLQDYQLQSQGRVSLLSIKDPLHPEPRSTTR
jgi:hypothetical protein